MIKPMIAFNVKNVLSRVPETKNEQQETSELELLLYGDVGGWGISAADIASKIQNTKADTILLRLNSYGGDVFEAIALHNYLRSEKRPVSAIVDGIAASAMTIIACGASNVIMPKGSLWMVHNPWTVAAGDGEEMRKIADMVDKVAAQCAEIYAARTGKTVDECKALMKSESWYSGAEAVAAGFVDIAEETEDVAASLDFEGMQDELVAKAKAKLAEIEAKAQSKNEAPKASTPQAPAADHDFKAELEAVNAELLAKLNNKDAELIEFKAKAQAEKEALTMELNNSSAKVESLQSELDKYMASIASFNSSENQGAATGLDGVIASYKEKYK